MFLWWKCVENISLYLFEKRAAHNCYGKYWFITWARTGNSSWTVPYSMDTDRVAFTYDDNTAANAFRRDDRINYWCSWAADTAVHNAFLIFPKSDPMLSDRINNFLKRSTSGTNRTTFFEANAFGAVWSIVKPVGRLVGGWTKFLVYSI